MMLPSCPAQGGWGGVVGQQWVILNQLPQAETTENLQQRRTLDRCSVCNRSVIWDLISTESGVVKRRGCGKGKDIAESTGRTVGIWVSVV